LRIGKHVANPRPTTENLEGFKEYLDKYLLELKDHYDLSIIPRTILVLGENDLRLIIESVIGSCDTNYDIAYSGRTDLPHLLLYGHAAGSALSRSERVGAGTFSLGRTSPSYRSASKIRRAEKR
jgi:hypothetical protein